MNSNNYVNKYLERLKSNKNNIENYYYKELNGLSEGAILNHLISISKLFETDKQRNEGWRSKDKDFNLVQKDINQLTEQHIKDFLNCSWWNNLTSGTKNNHLNRIKKYLKFSERKDLLNLLPKKINGKGKKLSKNDLISREDLDQILKNCNLKYRTLFMILYEGALRIDEALNIKRKDIKFNGGYIILKVSKSKTYGRDIPLIESISYLKEYLESNDFEPEDRLFNFKSNINVNNYLNFISKKLTEKYPKQWKGRKIHPHLFRHSRLTELARTKLNEAQIRKFAGWSADSTMAKVYFHLNDEDVINILTDEAVEIPKPKPKKPKMCEICSTENSQENLFCWKCGNVFSDDDKAQLAVEIISQPHEIQNIRQENVELKQELVSMKQLYKSEIKELRNEIKSMFNDLYYSKEIEKRIKSGEITPEEARIEKSGFKKEDLK